MKLFIKIRALNFIALFIFTINPFVYSQILKNIESNFLTINSDIIYNNDKSDSLISFIKKNEIDNILIHIYSNGEAQYNSKLISHQDDSESYYYDTFDSTSYHYDPLREIIDKFDTLNIKVHAWIDVYKLWDKNNFPLNLNHFYYQCPECLESDINGRSDQNIKLNEIQSIEWEGIFLSPLHPIVNNYILSIINEIVDEYNFDGIFLDYLRYQDYYYGYNSEGLNQFINIYHINPQDIKRGIISKKFGYNKSQIDSISSLWDNYKSEKITDLLKSINDNYKFDSLKIGVSVKSDPLESKKRWYQDWGLWIEKELIDYVLIEPSNNNFIDYNYKIKQINDFIDYDKKDKICFGLHIANQKKFDLSNRIISLRLNGFEKISLNYDFIKDTTNWYESIYKVINFNINK